MLVLALDSSTFFSSLAWVEIDENSKDAAVKRFDESVKWAQSGHGESLLPALIQLLERGGFGFADVDLIVFGRGPGTFTGLRIGLSVVKGLSLAHGIAAIGISSLEAMALSGRVSGLVAPLIDAKRGELYYSLYEAENGEAWPRATSVMDERVAPAAKAVADLASTRTDAPVFLTGNGIEPYRKMLADGLGARATVLAESCWTPSAYWMARIGQGRFAQRGAEDIDSVEPCYLRKPDAKLPGKPSG